MIIGVLSDTHIPKRAKKLPLTVLEILGRTDHIIHAGDIITLDVIETLKKLAPVTAVAGNADPPEIRQMLGEKKIITLGGFDFGIFHGHGQKGKTVKRAFDCFRDERVDCVIFGHSHNPFCSYENGVLLFNPGSPTDKRRNKNYSIGMIEINGKEITPRILFFNSESKII